MAAMDMAGRYRWTALGIAMISQCGNALASGVVAPLAPLFQPELGLSKTEVGIFSSALFFGTWCMLLVAGSLTDRLGVRRMMSTSQVVAGTVMLAMAASTSFFQALVVMFVVGLACSPIMPGSTKAIMDWFPPSARGSAMGLKQMAVPAAGVFAASVLPALGLTIGWRSAMAVVGFLIVSAGIATGVLYRDPAQPGKGKARRESMRAGVSSLLHNSRLWTVSAMAILFAIAQLSLIAYLPLYLEEVMLVPAIPDSSARIVAAGGFLALCQAGGMAGRVSWGVISDRLFRGRRRVVLAIVGALSALLFVAIAYLQPSLPLLLLGGLLVVCGATAIGWNGVYHALMGETAGARFAGTGVGLSMSFSQIGVFGGPPLFGLVVDLTGGYRPAWLLLAACCVGATVIGLLSARGEKASVT